MEGLSLSISGKAAAETSVVLSGVRKKERAKTRVSNVQRRPKGRVESLYKTEKK